MAENSAVYVVTGATGHVGGGIAASLLAGGKAVRAVGRSADRLQALQAKGAVPVVAMVDDAAALKKAFQGAKAVFLLLPPHYASPDYRAEQKKTVDAFARALAGSSVSHVVLLSSVGAHLPERTGPILGLHELEEAMDGIQGINVLSLRAGYFMENHFAAIPVIKGHGIYANPMMPDLKIAMIATRDIAAAAASRLHALDFTGKSALELLGQRDLAMGEVAAILGRAIGKPDLKYVQAPYEDGEKGMIGAGLSPNVAKLMIEMIRGFNEGTIRPTQPRGKAQTTPTSIEEFAKGFAAAFNA